MGMRCPLEAEAGRGFSPRSPHLPHSSFLCLFSGWGYGQVRERARQGEALHSVHNES